MKLLVLTPQLPYPPHQGTSLRNYHILRGLEAQGHAVTLLSYVQSGQSAEPEAIRPLLAVVERMKTLPEPQRSLPKRLSQIFTTRRPDLALRLYDPALRIALHRLLVEDAFDVVQIEGLELAWTMPAVRLVEPEARLVFDAHNAQTTLQQRALAADWGRPRRWPAALYSLIQVGRLRRYEAWALRQADAVVTVSEEDRQALEGLVPDFGRPVRVIPNCIDVGQYAAEPRSGDEGDAPRFDVVFSGKMDYRPNVDAALWFAEAVWPLVRQARPEATWAVVGQKPHPRLAALDGAPGVTVTGWVEAVQPYLAGAGVYVMPFRVGSGTRLKLIEAMAAGCAIVSTRLGAEGFPVESGRELVLADTPGAMADAIVGLLENAAARREMGQAARAFVQQYDWRQVIPRFAAVYDLVCSPVV